MKELDSIKKGIEQLEKEGARFLKILYEQNVKLFYENTELKEQIRKLKGESLEGSEQEEV